MPENTKAGEREIFESVVSDWIQLYCMYSWSMAWLRETVCVWMAFTKHGHTVHLRLS